MNVIQTKFNDHFFRSRLEARFAVLLHACGLSYQYEREGFELPLRRYLPDFWLPTLGIWLEVKGWTHPRWSKIYVSPSQIDRDAESR